MLKYFNQDQCTLIIGLLKGYMDDGFIVWRLKLNFGNGKETQILNFLDIKVEEDLIIKRGMYCKPTNVYAK